MDNDNSRCHRLGLSVGIIKPRNTNSGVFYITVITFAGYDSVSRRRGGDNQTRQEWRPVMDMARRKATKTTVMV